MSREYRRLFTYPAGNPFDLHRLHADALHLADQAHDVLGSSARFGSDLMPPFVFETWYDR